MCDTPRQARKDYAMARTIRPYGSGTFASHYSLAQVRLERTHAYFSDRTCPVATRLLFSMPRHCFIVLTLPHDEQWFRSITKILFFLSTISSWKLYLIVFTKTIYNKKYNVISIFELKKLKINWHFQSLIYFFAFIYRPILGGFFVNKVFARN